MFRIKLSDNMKKQLPEPDNDFLSEHKAYRSGVAQYGSGTFNSPLGWTVVKIEPED